MNQDRHEFIYAMTGNIPNDKKDLAHLMLMEKGTVKNFMKKNETTETTEKIENQII